MQPDRRRWISGSLAVAVTMAGHRLLRAQGSERVIPVVARKFVFLPSEIRLKLGEPVVLEFTAPEVVMGFSVPELKVRTDIIPGPGGAFAAAPRESRHIRLPVRYLLRRRTRRDGGQADRDRLTRLEAREDAA